MAMATYSRASDYNLYLDKRYDRFYVFSHDNNETFRWPEGPGSFGRGGEPGADMDPLSQVDSPNRPLIAGPALQSPVGGLATWLMSARSPRNGSTGTPWVRSLSSTGP